MYVINMYTPKDETYCSAKTEKIDGKHPVIITTTLTQGICNYIVYLKKKTFPGYTGCFTTLGHNCRR